MDGRGIRRTLKHACVYIPKEGVLPTNASTTHGGMARRLNQSEELYRFSRDGALFAASLLASRINSLRPCWLWNGVLENTPSRCKRPNKSPINNVSFAKRTGSQLRNGRNELQAKTCSTLNICGRPTQPSESTPIDHYHRKHSFSALWRAITGAIPSFDQQDFL